MNKTKKPVTIESSNGLTPNNLEVIRFYKNTDNLDTIQIQTYLYKFWEMERKFILEGAALLPKTKYTQSIFLRSRTHYITDGELIQLPIFSYSGFLIEVRNIQPTEAVSEIRRLYYYWKPLFDKAKENPLLTEIIKEDLQYA